MKLKFLTTLLRYVKPWDYLGPRWRYTTQHNTLWTKHTYVQNAFVRFVCESTHIHSHPQMLTKFHLLDGPYLWPITRSECITTGSIMAATFRLVHDVESIVFRYRVLFYSCSDLQLMTVSQWRSAQYSRATLTERCKEHLSVVIPIVPTSTETFQLRRNSLFWMVRTYG